MPRELRGNRPIMEDYAPTEQPMPFTNPVPVTTVLTPVRPVDNLTIQRTSNKAEKSKFLSMKTNFRTLKYSGDQPYDGTSNQPLMQKPLAQSVIAPMPASYGDNMGLTGVPLHSAIDKQRITKFLNTNSKGRLFGSKQKELQYQNPKMEVGTNFNTPATVGTGFIENLANTAINGGAVEYTRVYNNNSNLLQQVGVQGSGYHLDRPGNTPVTPFQAKYEYIVKHKSADKNRLVLLYDNKIQDTSFRNLNTTPKLEEINKLGIARSQTKLFEYPGGPNSNDINGWTVLQRYDYTNTWKGFSKYGANNIYGGATSLLGLVAQPKDYYEAVYAGKPTKYNIGPLSENDNAGTVGNLFGGSIFGQGGLFDGTGNIPGDYSNMPFEARRSLGADLPVAKAPQVLAPGSTIKVFKGPVGYESSNPKHTLEHKVYVDTVFNNEDPDPVVTPNRARTLTYSQIAKKGFPSNQSKAISADFRTEIAKATTGDNVPSTEGYGGSAGEGYLASNYGMGNPGATSIKRVNYKEVGYSGNDEGVDKINATDILRDTQVAGAKDLIKCIIRPVETMETGQHLESILVFRAFIKSFSDNINASYTDHQYVGRGEKFYTYNSADRKVNFELAIAAQSRAEMKPLYRKLNYLVSQMYPAYSGLTSTAVGNGFMRAPLVKMTIGDYLYMQPGFINSLQISIPDDSPWEIESANMDNANPNQGDMYQLPHYLTVNIQFTPIHNFIARRGSLEGGAKGTTFSVPSFITPYQDNGGGKNKFDIG